MKKIYFENRIIGSEVMAKSLVSCFFLTHGVYTVEMKVDTKFCVRLSAFVDMGNRRGTARRAMSVEILHN